MFTTEMLELSGTSVMGHFNITNKFILELLLLVLSVRTVICQTVLVCEMCSRFYLYWGQVV